VPSGLAVVTGASRGIGRALVRRLTSTGMAVVAISRTSSSLDEVAQETGAWSFALDVCDPAAVEDVFGRITLAHGVPDLLVNNAGISGGSGVTCESNPGDWWKVLEINVRGTYLCCRAVVPEMMARGSGRIVNLSSGAATFPVGLDNDGTITSAYMASKAAVNRFTEALAGECFDAGVRVFAMSPGMVKTDMTAEVFADLWDDHDTWTPVDRALDLIIDIDSGMLDQLSGRYLRAGVDDWRLLASRAEDVIALDTNALRLKDLS
jgi:3-oxoacyl-[acyl-carrier protein] reductase